MLMIEDIALKVGYYATFAFGLLLIFIIKKEVTSIDLIFKGGLFTSEPEKVIRPRFLVPYRVLLFLLSAYWVVVLVVIFSKGLFT